MEDPPMQPYRDAVERIVSKRKAERFEAKRAHLERRIKVMEFELKELRERLANMADGAPGRGGWE
jgi:hypothetical protein